MKAAEFSAALGDVKDAYIQEALTYKPKKTIYFVRAAVAACLCIAILGGVFANQKPAKALTFYQAIEQYNVSNLSAQVKCVSIGERTAYYYKMLFTNDDTANDMLEEWIGDKYRTEDSNTWYYPKGVNVLADLILKDGDGKYSLWSFVSFEVGEGGAYTYGEVMSVIYGVKSAEDIAKIVANPSRQNNTDLGLEIQEKIGSEIIDNLTQIDAFYEILKDITCYGEDSRHRIEIDNKRFSYSFSTDAQDKLMSGETIYGSRWLEIHFANGATIDILKYNALYGGFSEFNGIYSELLTDAEVNTLNSVFNIK